MDQEHNFDLQYYSEQFDALKRVINKQRQIINGYKAENILNIVQMCVKRWGCCYLYYNVECNEFRTAGSQKRINKEKLSSKLVGQFGKAHDRKILKQQIINIMDSRGF